MDVCESKQALPKLRAVETQRRPLLPAERNNAVTTRRPQTREISSRYKSSSPASPSGPQRCLSPNFTRTTAPAASKLLPKRACSAERKRPSAPPSPPSPSTPVHESSVHTHLSSRRVTGSRLPESLWPSTMRSLGVSFQSDSISIPVSKKEKPITSASDRTLRPASNVAHRQVESPTTRKPTPERKRNSLRGKNSDQSENSKPADSFHCRLIDQHRWPSRMGGKVSSNAASGSVDRTLNSTVHRTGLSSLRRLSLSEEAAKSLQKSSGDSAKLSAPLESGIVGSDVKPIDYSSLQVISPRKSFSSNPSVKVGLSTSALRSQSLQTPGSLPPSPRKISVPPSSRGVSPSRPRPSTPSSRGVSPSRPMPSTPPSRGVSPSRIRPTTSSSQSNSSISVLSFIADIKKGKKGAACIEDAHQLRLLYNRYLQWRFANARAEAVLYIQKATAEKMLCNVWNITLFLWDSVIRKRINLLQLKLELKLNSVLNNQMAYLDDWALIEMDHIDALSGAVEDLEASTLRLPVTGGAKADIENLKVAICSAVDVMQARGSTICSLLSRVEGINNLVSELAVVVAQEKAMLDECEALLASAAARQVEEDSLRTQLMQIKDSFEDRDIARIHNLNTHDPFCC